VVFVAVLMIGVFVVTVVGVRHVCMVKMQYKSMAAITMTLVALIAYRGETLSAGYRLWIIEELSATNMV
jgi:hypothetical protein